MKKMLAIAACVGLVACAGPKVRYEELQAKSDMSGKTKFQLADSVIIFAYGKTSQGGPDTSVMKITSVPAAAKEHTYAVSGTDWYENWGFRTDVNATHASNSNVLTQMGVVVTDQISGVATDVASAVTAAVAFLPSGQLGGGQPKEPDGLVISKLLQDVPSLCNQPRDGAISCQGLVLQGGGYPVDGKEGLQPYTADIAFDPQPPDATPLTVQKNGEAVSIFPFSSNSYIYSACRGMVITVKAPDGSVAGKASLLVADDSVIETLAIPPNGKVVAGTSCGADATAGNYTPPDFFKDSAAILTAAKSIKDSIKGSGVDGKKK